MPYISLFSTMLSLRCHLQCFSTSSQCSLQDPAHSHLWDKVCPHGLAQATTTFSFCVRYFSYEWKKIKLNYFMQNGELFNTQEQIAEKKGSRSTFWNFRNKRPEPSDFPSPCLSSSPLCMSASLSQTGLPHRARTEASGSSECIFSASDPEKKFLDFFLNYLYWDIFNIQ